MVFRSQDRAFLDPRRSRQRARASDDQRRRRSDGQRPRPRRTTSPTTTAGDGGGDRGSGHDGRPGRTGDSSSSRLIRGRPAATQSFRLPGPDEYNGCGQGDSTGRADEHAGRHGRHRHGRGPGPGRSRSAAPGRAWGPGRADGRAHEQGASVTTDIGPSSRRCSSPRTSRSRKDGTRSSPPRCRPWDTSTSSSTTPPRRP